MEEAVSDSSGGEGEWWVGEGSEGGEGGRMRCEASSTESRVMSQEGPRVLLGILRGDAADEEAWEEASDWSGHTLLLLLRWCASGERTGAGACSCDWAVEVGDRSCETIEDTPG
jgi:hypothetical protein